MKIKRLLFNKFSISFMIGFFLSYIYLNNFPVFSSIFPLSYIIFDIFPKLLQLNFNFYSLSSFSHTLFIPFIIFEAFLIMIVFTGLTGKNKRKIFFFLFSIYSIILFWAIIITFILFYNKQVFIGSNNLIYFLNFLISFLVEIFLLTKLNKNINWKYLIKTFSTFVIFILEIILTLFVGFSFVIKTQLSGSTLTDNILTSLFPLLLSFLIFLFLELFKQYLSKKLSIEETKKRIYP
jgi:hypothetical protein